MNQTDCNRKLADLRVIPVVKLSSIDHARPLADTLLTAGLPVAEVTLRSSCALQAIEAMSILDNVLIGAGTVLNTEQTKSAIAAGAKFIVSPGFDEGMVRYCRDNSVPIYPGVSTASEVQRAFNFGLDVVKLFPAEAVGGIKTLKALSGPFPTMRFMPTGGVNVDNLRDYLAIENVLAVGGSWMVKPELFAEGDFSQVIQLTQNALTQC